MSNLLLQEGIQYAVPVPCGYCTEHRAVFLAQTRPTAVDRQTGIYRFVFRCCGCHSTRLVRLRGARRQSHEGGEHAGEHC
jgi:hypothetical protein